MDFLRVGGGGAPDSLGGGGVGHKPSLPDEDLILWDNVVPTCETGYKAMQAFIILYGKGSSFCFPLGVGGGGYSLLSCGCDGLTA